MKYIVGNFKIYSNFFSKSISSVLKDTPLIHLENEEHRVQPTSENFSLSSVVRQIILAQVLYKSTTLKLQV